MDNILRVDTLEIFVSHQASKKSASYTGKRSTFLHAEDFDAALEGRLLLGAASPDVHPSATPVPRNGGKAPARADY